VAVARIKAYVRDVAVHYSRYGRQVIRKLDGGCTPSGALPERCLRLGPDFKGPFKFKPDNSANYP